MKTNVIDVASISISKSLRRTGVFIDVCNASRTGTRAVRKLQTTANFIHDRLKRQLQLQHAPRVLFGRSLSVRQNAHILSLVGRLDHRHRRGKFSRSSLSLDSKTDLSSSGVPTTRS